MLNCSYIKAFILNNLFKYIAALGISPMQYKNTNSQGDWLGEGETSTKDRERGRHAHDHQAAHIERRH
jgi:hypothetical protein